MNKSLESHSSLETQNDQRTLKQRNYQIKGEKDKEIKMLSKNGFYIQRKTSIFYWNSNNFKLVTMDHSLIHEKESQNYGSKTKKWGKHGFSIKN